MESVVEFLAVIHRVLGSITSLWGWGMERDGTGEGKGKQYMRKCCKQWLLSQLHGKQNQGDYFSS